jgi:homogentisate 1,2-dioxygenase
MSRELRYQSGFGNQFATESVPGALPVGRNSPQKAPHGLYAELISGAAFTAPRAENRRTWVYRKQPSVVVGGYRPYEQPLWKTGAKDGVAAPPDPMRWHPVPIPTDMALDFIDGLRTVVLNGDADAQTGVAAHLVLCNRSMTGRALVNADGEMLLVPQQGRFTITTELGVLDAAPGEIALLPRGIALRVDVDGPACAYVCENHGAPFRLPELGPIGSNGLANPRDFLAPVAAVDATPGPVQIIKKFGGALWQASSAQSPFNVVAWHGNLCPVKYDTRHFNTIGSISFDHPDPSIFTVLTSPSDTPGTANCDFVIFPPRWLVAEDTFRPPWYHRNLMSEFMGLVYGQYDAKPEGFRPGGASLHNSFVPHGPDADAFDRATNVALAPHKLDHTLAFMFESRWRFLPTAWALRDGALDERYAECWAGLKNRFEG